MPLSKLQKTLLGVGGAVGAGVLAWQAKFPWIKYDLQLMKAGSKVIKFQKEMFSKFLIDKFEEHASAQPQKAFVIFEDCVYTYEFMDQQANRVANLMRGLGMKFGDTVAMMIHNEPAFIWTLLGCLKLGVAVAFINYNLRSKHLSHSIMATDPVAVIVGAGDDLQAAVGDVMEDLQGLPVYAQGLGLGPAPQDMQNFDALMLQALPVRPDRSVREGVTFDSTAVYIYTSGTTGLPKPAYISTVKMFAMGLLLQFVDICKEDILYTCLPLYHSSGDIGLSAVMSTGCTMVLRNKFSASHFWPDCRKHRVTIIQYIGEIFRYILAQPESELDSVHTVKGAVGNGLRKDIFEEVQKRFKIPQIAEFFGATEGPAALLNIANRPGAIGRLSPLMSWIDPDPKVLVKYDMATATPIRDNNGRCMKIKPGETGLFIAKVPDIAVNNGKMTVYRTSQEASEKKMVRNAFKDGDLYFNFGDVFYLDSDYFVYFHDRIGDTFRWKGENVSTTEVANVLTSLDFILDANVYGVTMPGHDGRAGMAALSLHDRQTLTPEERKEIFKLCQGDLPLYARPLFLRVLREDVLTGTYKQRKVELREEGYDLGKVKDELFFMDFKAGTYSPLTPEGLVTFLHSKL